MTEQDITIKRDGLNLATKISIPRTKRYDVAILAYGFVGMMDPKVNDLLPVLAKKLQEEGMATIRFDFNGHGLSTELWITCLFIMNLKITMQFCNMLWIT